MDKNKFHRFAHPTKPLASPGNSTIAPHLNKFFDAHAHYIWISMDNWWTIVLWSSSTKLCNRYRKRYRRFALKYFCGIHIKSLTALKIFGGTIGIGGGQLPPLPPPLATRLTAARINSDKSTETNSWNAFRNLCHWDKQQSADNNVIQFHLTLKSTKDQSSHFCDCFLISEWIFQHHDRGLNKFHAGSE